MFTGFYLTWSALLQKHMYAILGVNSVVRAMNLIVSKMFCMIIYPQKGHSTSKGSTNTGV